MNAPQLALQKMVKFVSDRSLFTFDFSVKDLTQKHFSQSHSMAFRSRTDQFISLITSHPNYAGAEGLENLRSLFFMQWARASTIRWDNHHLVPLWRLVLNGFYLSDHHDNAIVSPCLCGERVRDRIHCFWSCPLAVSVRNALTEALVSADLPAVFSMCNLWLLQPPTDIDPYLWTVLCIISLSCMALGYRIGARAALNREVNITLESAQRRVVTEFRSLLYDFGSLALIPKKVKAKLNQQAFEDLFFKAPRPPDPDSGSDDDTAQMGEA